MPTASLSPLFLQPGVRLHVGPHELALSRDGIPVKHLLGVAETLALGLLASSGSAFFAREHLGRMVPAGASWVDRVVGRYWTYLGEGDVRRFDPSWAMNVAASRPAMLVSPMSQARAEAAPAAVTWMVTLGCNRRCPYCFFDVFEHAAKEPLSPPDATFPFEAAVRMVREMSAIGAADLYLTGGEPLLRRDLPEIVAEASKVRVRCHLVTKYPIRPPLAAALASAGLASLAFSLDDSRGKQAAALAGSPGFLTEARTALVAVLEAGVPLEVNAVATSLNAESLGDLASWLADLGVGTLRISPFAAPWPARDAAERLQTEVAVASLVMELAARHGDRIRIVAGSGAMAEAAGSNRACGAAVVCEVGTRALDVLPDGSVSRCHYLPARPDMVVGSLLNSTLLDAWLGDRLAGLVRPGREAYSGTACASCDAIEGCHSRGRCYVSSLASHGRTFAPDQFCVR